MRRPSWSESAAAGVPSMWPMITRPTSGCWESPRQGGQRVGVLWRLRSECGKRWWRSSGCLLSAGPAGGCAVLKQTTTALTFRGRVADGARAGSVSARWYQRTPPRRSEGARRRPRGTAGEPSAKCGCRTGFRARLGRRRGRGLGSRSRTPTAARRSARGAAADAPASRAASVHRPSRAACADSPASASPTMNWSSTWRASARQSRKRALAVLAAAADEHQPGVVDQRLDEPAVVAVAAPQLERLVEALLGLVEPAVDHGVPALLGQRPGGAVGISRRAVELERLAGERAGALPLLRRARTRRPGSAARRRPAIGSPTPRAAATAASHERGGVGGGDEHRPAARARQRRGLDGRLARPRARRRARPAAALRPRRSGPGRARARRPSTGRSRGARGQRPRQRGERLASQPRTSWAWASQGSARANAIATRSASSAAPARSSRSKARRMLPRSCASRSSHSRRSVRAASLRSAARSSRGSSARAGARAPRGPRRRPPARRRTRGPCRASRTAAARPGAVGPQQRGLVEQRCDEPPRASARARRRRPPPRPRARRRPRRPSAGTSSRRSGSSSASQDHSSVARSDRWRAGRSRGPPVSSSSRCSSRSSSAGSGSSRARSAASSIASGSPSRRAQMASTIARSSSKRPVAPDRPRARDEQRRGVRRRQRLHPVDVLGREPQRRRGSSPARSGSAPRPAAGPPARRRRGSGRSRRAPAAPARRASRRPS